MELFWETIAWLLVLTTVLVCYKLLRQRFPCTISCWFCGEKCLIPADLVNCWNCPHCDQYNGFKEDGDYNKTIPAQYCEDLNVMPIMPSLRSVAAVKGSARRTTNILCDNCNQNQFLKIKQLANFIPSAEENFDLEVEAYSRHLEQIYRLCRVCAVNVSRELAKQDASIQVKMAETKIRTQSHQAPDDSTESSQDNGALLPWKPTACILHLLTVVCAFALLITAFDVAFSRFLYFSWHSALPLFIEACFKFLAYQTIPLLIIGAFAKIIAVYISGLSRLRVLDAFDCFAWLIIMLFFFLLKDSHIYSQSLVLIRFNMSFLIFLLSLTSCLRCRSTNPRKSLLLHHSSPSTKQTSDGLTRFSGSEQVILNGDTSYDCESVKETVDVPYGKMRMLRLGTPVPKGRKDPFTVFGNVSKINISTNMPTPNQHRNDINQRSQYPLLSPPRFCPSSSSKELLSESVNCRPVAENGLLPGSQMQRHTSGVKNTSTSELNINLSQRDLTQRKKFKQWLPNGELRTTAKVKVQKQSNLCENGSLLKAILGVSLVFNLVAIVYVFLKFKTDISLEIIKRYFQNELFR